MEAALLLWMAVILAVSALFAYRAFRLLSNRMDRLEARYEKLKPHPDDSASHSPASPAGNPTLSREPPPIPRPSPTPSPRPPIIPTATAGPSTSSPSTYPGIQWEQFLGVKLIAWISGFVLFLGAVYFVKYSFDNHWISREIQMALAFTIGVGLVAWGTFLKQGNTTARALCATGIVILYAVCHASHASYRLIGPSIAFPLMTFITVAAFALAVRMNSRGMALWGLLGGFLTPLLISTGRHDALSLFGYIAILDAGLLAIAFRKRWNFLILLAALGTFCMQAGWFMDGPRGFASHAEILLVLGGFPLLFLGMGLIAAHPSPSESPSNLPTLPALLGLPLLTIVTMDTPRGLDSGALFPSIFGQGINLFFALTLFLLFLILIGCHLSQRHFPALAALLMVLVLQWTWHIFWQFDGYRVSPAIPLAWSLVMVTTFFLYPFLFTSRLKDRVLPWAIAALSAPLHFYLVYHLVRMAYPNSFMGLLPAAFALPEMAALAWIQHKIPLEIPARHTLQVWFGAAALFFITLIFPIQFQYEWILIGWFLEGAALLWLFQHIPHPGLRRMGLVLLLICFVMLLPDPLKFQPLSPIPHWFRHLYTYGIGILCLAAGARLLTSIARSNAFLLCILATVLGFRLMNLEIDDYFFSEANQPSHLPHLARDMTQSLAWALFAFGLLVIGMLRNVKAARYAGIALLGMTLLKLFLHDLAHLRQLYRIGALIGVASIGFLASFLYQRFLASSPRREDTNGKDFKPS